MQPELTLRAWGALIILYAIGTSVAIFAIAKAVEAVVDWACAVAGRKAPRFSPIPERMAQSGD